MATPFQPVLPSPVPYTEQELNYIDESPPGLFAENQNSNIGLKRKVFTDQMKQVSDQQAMLYAERFIDTANILLGSWEEEVGLPINPSGLTIQQRRSRITARLRTGPFTRTRRQQVIETFLLSTFGETIRLVPAGVPFTAGGLQLFSDATSLVGLYSVTENITNFSYQVNINSTATVDAAGLLRELQKVTPAGISFSIVYTAQPGPGQSFQKSGGGRAIASANGTQGSPRFAVVTWADMITP